MATKMTANGVSTTTTPGTEQYEVFYTGYRTRRRKHYQYDYRHTDGELYSCVADTLKECRQRRDEWLDKKIQSMYIRIDSSFDLSQFERQAWGKKQK